MDIAKVLEELCGVGGVSGGETEAHETALKLLREYAPDASVDNFGNVIGYVGCGEKDGDKPLLMLDAHIDRIGMVVTHIDDDGFLKVGGIGMDCRTLPAQSVTVFGREKVHGVVSTLPPHVAEDGKKAAKLSDICIDVGMTKEQAEESISLGDLVVLDGMFSRLAGTKVCSPATDDRAGVAAVLYALELLKDEKDLPFRIAAVFAAQEEAGIRGAGVAAYNVAPDYAIAVDVTFGVSSGVSSSEAGKLGKGGMIGIAASLNRELSEKLKVVAEEKEIPYQLEAMASRTGTDADAISVSRGGVVTGLISIPQRYMHTPCEVLDTEDIKATGRLIAEFVKGGF